MAIIGHVDARVLAQDLVDQAELNSELKDGLAMVNVHVEGLKASEALLTEELQIIQGDYVTSKNVGVKFRSSLPTHHPDTKKVDYNDLPFGDHTIWDFATGETHAPPVPEPMWMFVEMIRTYPYPPEGSLTDNAIQRAWGYGKGFLAQRSRYRNKWSEWVVMDTKNLPAPPETTE